MVGEVSRGNNAQRSRAGELAFKAGIVATLTSIPATAQAQVQNQNTQPSHNNNPPIANVNNTTLLETVTVNGNLSQINTNAASTASSRLPGTVQDIPQVVNTVPERVMVEQNVTTLEQALRNVPGITVSTGEGNGGMAGDRFRIRGFEAIGDQYRDGLRDFGVYARDSFNMEQVQVFKGPSGESFGVGTTGGAVNMKSKQAKLGTFGRIDGSIGTGTSYRSTLDYNKQINDTTAARFNLMGNWQDMADRDHVDNDRWGAAASVGFGLGTEQTWHLDYMFQHNDRAVDYGVPFVQTPSGRFRPVTEYGVSRDMFYGKDTDRDKSDVHMLTSTFSREVNDWLTIKNDTRYTHVSRWFSATPANCGTSGGVTKGCTEALFGAGGNPILAIGAGGGVSYDQTTWGIQNVTTAIAKFDTGSLRHEAVFGLDMMYQDDERQGLKYVYSSGRAKTPPTLWDENTDSSNYNLVNNPDNLKESDSRNFAFFVSDRVWLTEQFSIVGGVRWDYQKINYDLTSASGVNSNSTSATFASPKASLIWEPTENQTYYISFARSNNLPFGQYISSDVNPISAGREDVDPETSDLYELGGKIDLLNGRLGLTGAIFQVEKDNSIYADPNGDLTYTGEKQRVRGVELGVTGELTMQWNVYASYSFLDSEVLDASDQSIIGNSVAGAAKNAATLWTTYNLAPHFDGMEGKFLVGGGMTYRDAMSIRSDNRASVPHSYTLDALVSYETEKWNLSLNAYNLTDRVNYDNFFQGSQASVARAIPSEGRTFVVKLGTKF